MHLRDDLFIQIPRFRFPQDLPTDQSAQVGGLKETFHHVRYIQVQHSRAKYGHVENVVRNRWEFQIPLEELPRIEVYDYCENERYGERHHVLDICPKRFVVRPTRVVDHGQPDVLVKRYHEHHVVLEVHEFFPLIVEVLRFLVPVHESHVLAHAELEEELDCDLHQNAADEDRMEQTTRGSFADKSVAAFTLYHGEYEWETKNEIGVEELIITVV